MQVLVFYRNNPGVIETMHGLATRLGTSVPQLQREIADHLKVGILKKTPLQGSVLLEYDRAREEQVEGFIEQELERRAAEVQA